MEPRVSCRTINPARVGAFAVFAGDWSPLIRGVAVVAVSQTWIDFISVSLDLRTTVGSVELGSRRMCMSIACSNPPADRPYPFATGGLSASCFRWTTEELQQVRLQEFTQTRVRHSTRAIHLVGFVDCRYRFAAQRLSGHGEKGFVRKREVRGQLIKLSQVILHISHEMQLSPRQHRGTGIGHRNQFRSYPFKKLLVSHDQLGEQR